MLDHVSITVADVGSCEPFYGAIMTATGSRPSATFPERGAIPA